MEKIYTNELRKFIGKKVTVAGWVHDVRLLGKIAFLLLRDKEGVVQVTASEDKVKKNILKEIKSLHQEDVVVIEGNVVKSKVAKVGIEIIPEKLEVMNRSEVPLPLDPREVTPANLDTKLDWRFMYFRTKEAKTIFKIQSQIINAFREFCLKNGFIEMQPPVIISSASEGGAELFEIPYFEKKAFLAQSPQLYKQMGAISFEKVFMIVPVFRAEKFDQPTHLNEIRQMDVEIAFADDEDAMDILEDCFFYILNSIKKNSSEELKILKHKLKIPKRPLKRITYSNAIKLLQKANVDIKFGQDFTKVQERMLPSILGTEAFFIKDWPKELKAFYSMPNKKDPKFCKAFDLIHNGLEICSGTQRIHLPDLLIKQIKSKGLNPENFKYYIDVFKYGAPIHSGWSIGLERFTMTITGRTNIREVTMFPRDRNRLTP